MTRPGRKRKALAHREPSGQIQRPTMAQLNEMATKREDREKLVVLAQPHRRGDTSQLRASPLGCFVLENYSDQRMARAVYDAGLDYAAVVRRWRAARGVPTELRAGGGLSSSEGPSAATVARWWGQISQVDTRLVYEGSGALLKAVRSLVLDERSVSFDARLLKLGLGILSEEMGRITSKRHPFRA
jgi:hypothetical protein